MKNQRGVTLIALVVTIIVLIIIAGIAIAALMGDNGVITRSKAAKQSQIEGEVKDKVTLAVASAKMLAEQKTVESSGYSASKDLNSADSLMLNELKAELNGVDGNGKGKDSGNGYTVTIKSKSDTDSTVTISYTTADYQQAKNSSSAKIEVDVNVKKNVFDIKNYVITPAN